VSATRSASSVERVSGPPNSAARHPTRGYVSRERDLRLRTSVRRVPPALSTVRAQDGRRRRRRRDDRAERPAVRTHTHLRQLWRDDVLRRVPLRGRGFVGVDANVAEAVLASVRENYTAQAAGRYARNTDGPVWGSYTWALTTRDPHVVDEAVERASTDSPPLSEAVEHGCDPDENTGGLDWSCRRPPVCSSPVAEAPPFTFISAPNG